VQFLESGIKRHHSLIESCTPMAIIPGGMNYAQNQNCITRHFVDHAIGEATRSSEADVAPPMTTRSKERIVSKRVDGRENSGGKLSAKSSLFTLIPFGGLEDIILCFRPQPHAEAHFTNRSFSRALTSSQGIAESGSRS